MPCERKHIEAIRAKIRDLRVEDGLIGSDDRITVLLDAALSACDESPWRSMESAPLGVHVLLWAPLHVGRPIIAFKASNGAWQWSGRVVYHPTHWMPLPAAPEVGNV